MDYIYIDVPSLDAGMSEEIPVEKVKTLFNCAKNGTLMDVVLVSREEGKIEARIIGYAYVKEEGALVICFYSIVADRIFTWNFTDPDIEES